MSTDAPRRRELAVFAAALLVLLAIVGVVVVASGGSSARSAAAASSSSGAAADASSTAAPSGHNGLRGVDAVRAEFAGVPQRGNALGDPQAPARLVMFGDLQCPFCAQFENGSLPALVKRYVKPGKLRVVFQPIAILGSDSVLGARAAAAAAEQDKMFAFNALLYRNQGRENSGYMTAAYVKRIAAGVPGLDLTRFGSDLQAAAVTNALSDARALANSGHVVATPTFFVARGGGPLQALQITSLAPSAFYGELDRITR